MKNLFTFEDMTGKRRLRSFVKVAIGAFVLIIAVGIVNTVNRNRMMNQIFAEPRPVSVEVLPTPEIVVEQPVVEECPTDPADWTFTENPSAPGSNLMKLSTECVYNELEKTAAWLYATSAFGYSRREAADLFGFSQIPMQYQFDKGRIMVETDFKNDPQAVELRFPSDNTGLKEWRIDANGQPAVEFVFNGCFRTSSMSGGEIISWGDGYPVVCQYSADFETRHYVSDVNGMTLTINGSENVRRLLWFGYAGDGGWVFLGFAKDWEYDLSEISNRGTSTINPSVMSQKYNAEPFPLPESWAAFTGQEFVDAFLKELDISE
ncbi:MAG TPA: hypothetical protein VJ987_07305 [Anaerolineales bacterium]|nr:hypothetical protein [Anaerolineales bacterium]